MQENLTKIYEGADLSGAVNKVIYLPILKDATLTGLDVLTDEAATSDATFSLSLNGVSIAGEDLALGESEQITIAAGTKIVSLTGLEIALVKGDEITLDLLSGAVSSPLTLNLTVDDGQSSGGGTGAGGTCPDCEPATPDAMDDEFNSSSLNAKWTAAGGGINSQILNGDGAMVFQVEGLSYGNYETGRRYLLQNLPASGDWKFRSKISILYGFGQYFQAGMMVFESATQKAAGVQFVTDNSFPQNKAGFAKSGNLVASGMDFIAAGLASLTNQGYFQIEKSGDNLIYGYSFDGRGFITLATRSIAADFSTAPDKIGFGCYATFIKGAISCDWFRRIS